MTENNNSHAAVPTVTPRARRGDSSDEVSPRAIAMQALPDGILAVGLRNNRKRFFIPSNENSFAGISCNYVMADSGCNSLLLPFHSDKADVLQFVGESFFWEIGWSKGTATLHSPTILI